MEDDAQEIILKDLSGQPVRSSFDAACARRVILRELGRMEDEGIETVGFGTNEWTREQIEELADEIGEAFPEVIG